MAKKKSTKSGSRHSKTTMSQIRKTVGDAAESISETTSNLVKRASKALGFKNATGTKKSKSGTAGKRTAKKKRT